MQLYLETVIAREDGVKEVKLFQLGPRLLQRYRDIFRKLFVEDRRTHDSAGHLGVRTGPAVDCGTLWRVWLDRPVRQLRGPLRSAR